MSNNFRLLSDDEVRQIASLMGQLEQSSFDYLRLELGDLKLTLGKGPLPTAAEGLPMAAPVAAVSAPAAAGPAPAPAPAALAPAAPAALAPAASASSQALSPAQEGTVAITAPIVGRFYAQPEPGAPPFAAIGAEVNEDTTVGLLEVMKVYNAVRAGVRGVITEMCVQDAQFVEFGQALYRVRPTGANE